MLSMGPRSLVGREGNILQDCFLSDVPEVQVSRVQEVSLVNHVPHPLAVVHVTLTSLYAGKSRESRVVLELSK